MVAFSLSLSEVVFVEGRRAVGIGVVLLHDLEVLGLGGQGGLVLELGGQGGWLGAAAG